MPNKNSKLSVAVRLLGKTLSLEKKRVEAAEPGSNSWLLALCLFNRALHSRFRMLFAAFMIMPVITNAQSLETTVSETTAMPTEHTSVDSRKSDEIERQGEGRHFFTTIKIPAGAETLYLSGSGAASLEDGSWGDMEQQTVATFTRFKETLEAQGWSLADIVQVRAFALADEYGLLDFDGFNRGYRKFFGSDENPLKPVRSFVQIKDLVVPGWLVEIEIRAARMPD